MLKTFLRFIAFILLALFTIAFPVSLVIHDVGSLVFNPATTETLVRDNLLNSKYIASVSKQVIDQMMHGGKPNGAADTGSGDAGLTAIVDDTLAKLTDADWQQITDLVAPTALLDETVTQVVDAYTAWLNSDQPFPPLNLDLTRWKENTHNNAPQIMTVLLNAVPGCTAEQIDTIATKDLQTSEGVLGGLQGCRPPEPYYSAMVSNAPVVFDNLLSAAPNSLDLDLMTQNAGTPKDLAHFKASLLQVRTVVNWGWVALSALGLIAALLGSRGWNSFLRWVGWPVLFSGAFIVVLGGALQFFTLHFLDAAIGSPLAAEGGAVGVLGTAIAGGALDLVNKTLLLQGLVLSGLGASLIYIAHSLSRRAAATGIPINRRKIGL